MRMPGVAVEAPWVKIVATLGPATSSAEQIERLLVAGVNVVRLNFSHGTHAEHADRLRLVRAISQRLGRSVAVMQDLQGPKIRIGRLVGGGPVMLVPGARLTITTHPLLGTVGRVSTTYEHLPHDVQPGDRVLLNDGLLELRVLATTDDEVETEVVVGGPLGENKGINLPGVRVSAPAITPKDRDDLRFGLEHGVDYVAISFVRRPDDVRLARAAMAEIGRQAPIIVKLEKPEALNELEDILALCDGVMVARGDLGVELSPEQVPLAQKLIIRRALARGVPVITATQMLESMVGSPRPTRAEASDVANAVLDGTDAVMLSAETAVGQYPVETVRMMATIARTVEREAARLHGRWDDGGQTHAQALCGAAVQLAEAVGARALVVFTRSGRTAQLASNPRPCLPIYAFTTEPAVARSLAVWWGVTSLITEIEDNTDAMIERVERELLARGLVRAADTVVIVGAAPVLVPGQTNFIKLHTIGASAPPAGTPARGASNGEDHGRA
jgi:pyruvate kinase